MAVSRPVLLALLGAVLLAATFMATRSASTDDRAKTAAAPAPASPAQPDRKDAAANKPSTTKSQGTEKKPAEKQASRTREKREEQAKKAALPGTGASNGLPLRVAKALADRDVVVLLFSHTGADDAATRASVRSLRGRRGVAVFNEDLKHLSNYRRIVAGLSVSEAPSVVIVGRDLHARVVEGYVDEGSLRQHVRDVR
jgi:hypothetical protein